jgi:LPS O-antigen subunit length determinant protein (WzzB/FepE family)
MILCISGFCYDVFFAYSFFVSQKWTATIAIMILTPSFVKVYVDQHTKLQKGLLLSGSKMFVFQSAVAVVDKPLQVFYTAFRA